MSVSIVGSDGKLVKAAQTGFSGADELTKSIQNVSLLKEDITKSLDDTTNEKVPGALLVKNTFTTTLAEAKTYADNQADAALVAAKTYADTEHEIIMRETKSYADDLIKNLIGAAPETMNTLEEISTAISEHEDVVEAMEVSVTANAKSYADDQDAAKLAEAKTYADDKDASTLSTAKSYTDTQTAATLAEAKTYADNAGAKYSTVNFTIPSGSSGTKTLSNSRITTALNPLCTLNSGSAADYAKITSITTNNGSISVVLSSATSADLVITLHGIPE